jgi:HEAT repeat protein
MLGVGLALVVSITALWGKISGPSATAGNSVTSAAFSDRDLDLEQPQKQAMILLERAVSRSGEVDQTEAQIEARVDAWRGNLKWDSQLGDLTTVALNSRDLRLRSSAVEVQLAAYGLPKSESSVDALVRQSASRDHAKKIWALWMLGLLGNRGVATDRVVQVLTAQLKDPGKDSATGANKDRDEDARRWAVQGLALVGTTPTIMPLLDAMHNDPSATVRERAASSLAESAMLSQDQRLIAVPQLIDYSSDPALDAATHALAFQALTVITKQHLPNDSASWRNWYQASEVTAQ